MGTLRISAREMCKYIHRIKDAVTFGSFTNIIVLLGWDYVHNEGNSLSNHSEYSLRNFLSVSFPLGSKLPTISIMASTE